MGCVFLLDLGLEMCKVWCFCVFWGLFGNGVWCLKVCCFMSVLEVCEVGWFVCFGYLTVFGARKFAALCILGFVWKWGMLWCFKVCCFGGLFG